MTKRNAKHSRTFSTLMEMEKFIRIAIEFKLIYEYLYLGYYYNY